MLKRKIKLSVVCASHRGEKKLYKLINSIAANTILPSEIIICHTSILDLKFVDKKKIINLNIRSILCKIKNQTYQRNIAINAAANNLILQIDDDIILKYNFFEKLISNFTNLVSEKTKIVGAMVELAPSIPQANTWNIAYNNFFLFRLILLCLNFFKKINQCVVIKSGRIIPIMFDDKIKLKEKRRISNIEWLGSTICYNKKYATLGVQQNYSEGLKSYYEDVFFTHSMFSKGFKLIIDKEMIGWHKEYIRTSFSIYLKTIKDQYNIVSYFRKSYICFFFDVFIFSILHICQDLKFILKNEKKL